MVPTKSAVSPHFYITRIMPIGLGMSLALLFGNLVYLQLSMSFIQMLKVRLGWPPSLCSPGAVLCSPAEHA